MDNNKENEGLIKDKILVLFSQCISENPCEPKDKLFMKLCDHVYRWCKGYKYKKDTEEMGLEIVKAVENTVKNVKSENYFFGYLTNRLKDAKNQCYRVKITGSVNINKTFNKYRLKDIKKVLEIRESNIARKLSENECIYYLSKWFEWDEKVSHECFILLNREFPNENELNENNFDYLNLNVSSPYVSDVSTDPIKDYFHKDNINKIEEAISIILTKKQDRSRPSYKALFTLYCVENIKDYKVFLPILDHRVIADHQDNGEKPTQYQIYQKYHPNASKSSSEVMASKNLKEFLSDLENYLKEKYPEIFH